MVEATLKVEMNGHDDPLVMKTPKRKPQEALHHTLATKAQEGLFNASNPLLAKPSRPISGSSLAQIWKENSAVDGHLMSELFDMAKIEYDPETELAIQKNRNRVKQCKKPLTAPEGMTHLAKSLFPCLG